jgi:hypothetical protein
MRILRLQNADHLLPAAARQQIGLGHAAAGHVRQIGFG